MPEKRTIPRLCEYCHQSFFAYPAKVKKGQARFCSTKCSGDSRIDPQAPERNKVKQAAWRAANHEYLQVKNREWREANSEHMKQTQAAHYAANREERKAQQRQYRIDNPEKVRASNAAWRAKQRIISHGSLEHKKPTSLIYLCEICSSAFSVYPSRLKHGRPIRYCSRACASIGQRNREERICEQCQQPFLARLSRLKKGQDRFCSVRCRSIARKIYPDKRTASREYRKTHIEEEKAYKASVPDKVRAWRRKYNASHRERINELDKANRAKNPERYKKYQKTYKTNHPEKGRENTKRRRARLLSAPINDFTDAQWQEIKMAYGYRCQYCHKKFPDKKLTAEHIIPLSKGGSHTASNIVPACKPCNSKKSVGPPLTPVQPLFLTLAPPKPKEQS